MTYIDMHCDTLSVALAQKKDTIYELEGAMLDVKRLQEAGCRAQFFAMFLPQEIDPAWFGMEELPEGEVLLEKQYGIYRHTIEQYGKLIAPAGNYQDYISNAAEGKISAFLTIENGYLAEGNLDNIKKFYEMGVRLITLTWNQENCLGMCHSKDIHKMQQGLTEFGKEAVSLMNELGMLVDVSHLSDGGFYDVAGCSKRPFVASHSNCRALCPASRNLTDDMIRILAQKGGVAGINLEPSFVNRDVTHSVTGVEGLCAHVDHLYQVGGEDCIGIGTDFDGISGAFEIKDCTRLELLFHALQKRGYSGRQLDKFASDNVLRVIKDTLL